MTTPALVSPYFLGRLWLAFIIPPHLTFCFSGFNSGLQHLQRIAHASLHVITFSLNLRSEIEDHAKIVLNY